MRQIGDEVTVRFTGVIKKIDGEYSDDIIRYSVQRTNDKNILTSAIALEENIVKECSECARELRDLEKEICQECLEITKQDGKVLPVPPSA